MCTALLGLQVSEESVVSSLGWELLIPVWLVVLVLFWLWTPWFLLHREIALRRLFPGAVLVAVSYTITMTISEFLVGDWINENGRFFGAFGVALALLAWGQVLGGIWLGCAVLSPVYAEWRAGWKRDGASPFTDRDRMSAGDVDLPGVAPLLGRVRSWRLRVLTRVRSVPIGVAALGRAKAGYSRHATSEFAAAISYRMLFSLVPLLALLVSVMSLIAPDELRRRLGHGSPAWSRAPGSKTVSSGRSSSAGSAATVATIVAIPRPLWAASEMMRAIRRAFRVIWDSDSEAPYLRGKLRDLALVARYGRPRCRRRSGFHSLVEVLAELGRDLSELIGGGTGGRIVATGRPGTGLAPRDLRGLLPSLPDGAARPAGFAALWPALAARRGGLSGRDGRLRVLSRALRRRDVDLRPARGGARLPARSSTSACSCFCSAPSWSRRGRSPIR